MAADLEQTTWGVMGALLLHDAYLWWITGNALAANQPGPKILHGHSTHQHF